jgi:ubiquinone/menaquinone biosynthesis C-methylase UbiE
MGLKNPAAPMGGISASLQQATGNALAISLQAAGNLLSGIMNDHHVFEILKKDIQKMDEKIEKIFFEIHSDNPREGPGNFESTKKAFDMLADIPARPRILDVGCGPGKQTLDLAALSKGSICAIDTHLPYLEGLEQKIFDKTLQDRISVRFCDMAELTFDHGFFDVIWAEGSIYIIGFEKGLKLWKPFLKPKGYMAVTEVSWLKDNPPKDIWGFWNANYPAICTIEQNLSMILQAGFDVVGHFVLTENAWWDDYYHPIEEKLIGLHRKYAGNPQALEVLAMEQEEIDLYRKHSEWYGYVFYVLQNRGI